MKGIFFRKEINVSHYQGEVIVGYQPIKISLVFAGTYSNDCSEKTEDRSRSTGLVCQL